jgi:hypothetical protein
MRTGKRKCLQVIFLVVTALLFLPPSYAEVSLHGFLEGNYSFNTASQNPSGSDLKLAEETLQLRLNTEGESYRLVLKTRAIYDHIAGKTRIRLREGYFDYAADDWEVTVGRQVITWGVGDLIFINDVFPKSYAAFFGGKPLEYMKKGIDGIRIGLYPASVSLEIVVIPFFTPDDNPSSDRFWLFDPMPSVTDREEKKPSTTIENTEIALRAYRDISGFDTSVYFYKGFFRQPSLLPEDTVSALVFYPEVSVYGISLQGRAAGGILSLEAGYYESRQDRNGTDPVIPNSRTKFLLGYQRQLRKDFTAGVQYYCERMHRYSAYERNVSAGLPVQKRLYQLVTLRLTRFFMHRNLRLSVFSFYSPSYGDYMLNPEVKYNFTDDIWAAAGGNLFGGGYSWSRFGQMDRDDNIYLQIRYEF